MVAVFWGVFSPFFLGVCVSFCFVFNFRLHVLHSVDHLIMWNSININKNVINV